MRQFRFPRLKKRYRPWFWALVAVIIVVGVSVRVAASFHTAASTPRSSQLAKPAHAAAKSAAKAKPQRTDKPKPHKAPSVMRTPIDWQQPSETVAYPKLTTTDHVTLQVSLAKQRVYVLINGKTSYTMYASSGIHGLTPKGHFQIGGRGDHFYTPSEKMGANYWTAFSGSSYLFHSVPTDINGNYIAAEAAKLGKEPGSHGCVRLSVPDAKWVNQTIPAGTPVIIS